MERTTTVIREHAAEAVFQPSGNLATPSTTELRAMLRSAVADGVRTMTLDLARVQAVDSLGVSLVVSAHNSLRKAGGRLAVINASQDVAQLLHLLRIDEYVSISMSTAEPA